ncbi:hypothetical protein EV182_001805 [Spiromyces aspiralis]|uniref:Uncharacterized protein n=1 Tax=Spiromyces aspiralis TaxID=68401 RepID=A0ACC1HF00_9FUNG|nr:hypothetical protein EV182_001805 [Spiromyces aspiralis]
MSEIVWDTEKDLAFLQASLGLKPVGGDDEQHRPLFTQDTADTDDINFWRKNIYEFSLPWQEFGEMMMERTGATLDEDQDDSTSVAAADAVSTISSVKVESPDADAESTFGEQQPATPAPSKKRKTKPGSGATATTTPAAKGRAKAPKSAQSLRKRTTKSRN